MPSATSILKLPWPLGTDRLMDGDDMIRKLAQSVENMLQAGQVSIPITAINTNATAAVTFPVPYLSAPLAVVVSWAAGTIAGSLGQLTVSAITATGFSVTGIRTAGTAPVNAAWLAIGPVNTVS